MKRFVLIIECDSEKLRAEGKTIATKLNEVISAIPNTNVVHIVGKSQSELLSDLGEASTRYGAYDIVIVIGHSNRDEMQIASDSSKEWHVVAEWVEPFNPWALILVACESGRWMPCQPFFEKIENLDEVYGSPVTINESQLNALFFLIPYLLLGEDLPDDVKAIGQYLNFTLTGGIVFQKKREDYESGSPWDEIKSVLFEELAEIIKKRLGS